MTPPELYFYPKETDNNLYLQSCRRVWESIGFKVSTLPTNLSALITLATKRREVVVLNWIEDRLGHAHNQFAAFIKITVLVLLCRIAFKRVIWVRHNLKPHNQHSDFFYQKLLALLSRVADQTVTHRPVSQVQSSFVPHPLYLVDSYSGLARDQDFICFGAVKPYKGIDNLLRVWPQNLTLHIMGPTSDEAYARYIESIIEELGLDVHWVNEFVDYEELSKSIARSNFAVIPHLDKSMIVSGAFFHAASLGANILVREGELYTEYLKQFSFVTPFKDENLPLVLQGCAQQAKSREAILTEVDKSLSDQLVAKAWSELLHDR